MNEGELQNLHGMISDACGDTPDSLLYRGESENYPDVSSTLRRTCSEWRIRSNWDLNDLQRILTNFASQHDNPAARRPRQSDEAWFLWSGGYDPTKMTEQEFELIAEMQHFGAATNLIDFTRDINVAIYFACEEKWECDGRIIVVKEEDRAQWKLQAKTPPHRAQAQASVFLRPPNGIVEPWQQINVNKDSKGDLLDELSQLNPPVSPFTMYNDLFGYVRLSERYLEGLDHYHEAQELFDQRAKQMRIGSAMPAVPTKALESLREASEYLFSAGGVRAELGRAYFAHDEFEEAKDMLKQALRLGFATPSIYMLLACIASFEGDKESVLGYAKTGIDICNSQNGSEDEDIKKRLEAMMASATAE